MIFQTLDRFIQVFRLKLDKIIPFCPWQECKSHHRNMQELTKNVSARQIRCKSKIRSRLIKRTRLDLGQTGTTALVKKAIYNQVSHRNVQGVVDLKIDLNTNSVSLHECVFVCIHLKPFHRCRCCRVYKLVLVVCVIALPW